jgi:DNA-binding GntR family transcriptional regulator
VKIKRRSAADSIADNLRARIMSGSLPPRERLVEAELAEQLSVSRTPLREALQQLESEGFAARLIGGGLVVTGLDEPDLQDLLWLRSVLECELAREVARTATAADVEDLSRILDQMESVSDHPPLFIELGRGFHDRLAAIFGNQRCRTVLRTVRQHADRYWNLTTAHQPERTGLAATEHRAILAAIRGHDEETAVKRMRAHLRAEAEVCLAAVRATQAGEDSPQPPQEAAS